MKYGKILLIFVMSSILNFSYSVSEIVSQIGKDYEATNKIKNFSIKSILNEGASSEGVEIKYYSKNGEIRKIVATYYGESGKRPIEYYLKNNKVYFIYDVILYYDGILTGKVAKKEEKRYYFDPDGILVRYIDENKITYEDRDILENIEKEIIYPWD